MTPGSAPSGEFEATVTTEGDRLVIRLRGELDLATSDALAARLAEVRDTTRAVELDLGELAFMDASGLRVLLSARESLGERLVLLPGPPPVQRLFALTGTEARLGFTPPPPDAQTERAAANVAYLRELWRVYSAGGVQALAERLPPSAERLPADVSGWGAAELAAFWARAGARGAPASPSSCRTETLGTNVLVASPTVVWSVYLFDGRTFLRAASFSTESEARDYAGAGRLS